MRQAEVLLDDRWFLPVPTGVDLALWAHECVATLPSEPGRDPDQTAAALVDLASDTDAEALATLLFCPDGLPGRAFVSIYATESDLTSLEELPELAPAALPRQVLPLRGHDPAQGRVISTLTQVPGTGVVGILQYELLRDGALLEVVAVSPSLDHLGLGMPVFEELIERIAVDTSDEAVHVPA